MENSVLNEYKKLVEEVKRHNYYYYTLNESIISDMEYDKLLKKIEEYEQKYPELLRDNSPTQTVGDDITSSKFQKVEHRIAMKSLSNTYNIGEVKDFTDRVIKLIERENVEYVVELKLDGLSISCIYEKGKLVRAVTRGDGKIGEDVTENIMQIKSVPHYLKEEIDLEVRGEVLLPIPEFEKINKDKLERGEELFANPRNAASGTLRQLDINKVKERGLDCYFYYLMEPEKYGIDKHINSFAFMKRIGLKVNENFTLCHNVDEMEATINKWEKDKEALNYETDGLVIKVNELNYYDILGSTTKSPRWAIAYKFPAKQATTKLLDVTYQVGRTGTITPVAELEPVELSGSVVKRATLHNFDEVIRKGIKIGDRVFIEKAAEIIPQVVKPVIEVRTGEEKDIVPPENCPVCETKLEKEDVYLKCPNSECPERIQRTIEYFCSRDGMSVDGLGEKIIRKLIELGKIKRVADIYYLKKEELVEIERFGERSVNNLLESIEKSKEREFSKVIFSLGIPFVGKFLADILTNYCKTIEKLMTISKEELLTIEGIGDKVADGVTIYFSEQKNIELVEELKRLGLQMSVSEDKKNISDKLAGLTFLVTGTLSKYKREEIKEMIEKNGGKYLSGVSKNLNYLIAGEEAGSKLEKAEKLGVKIIGEDEFEKML